MTELTFIVLPEEDGKLIKQILRVRGVSVRLTNSLKRVPGGMRLNGGSVARTIDPVKAGDVLTLAIPGDETVPEPIEYAHHAATRSGFHSANRTVFADYYRTAGSGFKILFLSCSKTPDIA